MKLSFLNPSSVAAPMGGRYSHVARVDVGDGALLFVSGQLPLDLGGNLVGESDMGVQTDRVYAALSAILVDQGASWSNVVKLDTYLTDLSRMPEHAEVRMRYLASPPPSSTLVGVTGLVVPGALVEVDLVAAIAGA